MHHASEIFDPRVVFLYLFLLFFYPIEDIMGRIKYLSEDNIVFFGVIFLMYIVPVGHVSRLPYPVFDSKYLLLFRALLFELPILLFSNAQNAPKEYRQTVDDKHPCKAYK